MTKFVNEIFLMRTVEMKKEAKNWYINWVHCALVRFALPVTFLSSSSISSLPLDLGILPTNKRVFGSLTFILRDFPSSIS